MINVGFIGLGGMGRHQIRSFAKVAGATIAAGAAPSQPACRDFAKHYPKAAVYEDPRKLLGDSKVDAVVVAVPTFLHKSTAIDALRSGRPVLVEKPIARTVADAHRMIEAARKAKQLLMVAHCRRFDKDWGTIAEAYRSGLLGQPVLWRHVAASSPPGGWFMDHRLGGGPLLDGAVHDYDFANCIFGRPERVWASAIKLNRKVTALDTGSAVVQYGSGNQLMLSWSWHIRGAAARDILGPKGSLQPGSGNRPMPKGIQTGCYCFTDAKGKQKLLKYRADTGAMYRRQARHFLDCILRKTRCQSPATEAIKAVAVAEAIQNSARKGHSQRVVW